MWCDYLCIIVFLFVMSVKDNAVCRIAKKMSGEYGNWNRNRSSQSCNGIFGQASEQEQVKMLELASHCLMLFDSHWDQKPWPTWLVFIALNSGEIALLY